MDAKKDIEEIKARIARRKKQLQMDYSYRDSRMEKITITPTPEVVKNEPEENRPEVGNVKNVTANKNGTIFRLVVSVFLIISVAIIYRLPYSSLQPAKQFIGQVFRTDFPFAKNNAWISEKLGELYVLTPWKTVFKENNKVGEESVPVSGKIRESFRKNGKGIVIETDLEQKVRAIEAGIVIFSGQDNKLGKTIIIQQANGMNVWYGQLSALEVGLYDQVKKGDNVGQAANNSDDKFGQYYFAIEKDNAFVDPMQVIFFE